MTATQRKLLVPLFVLSLFTPVVAAEVDERLSKRQAGVAQRYQKLEELLLRLADVEAAENPERSALLRRAARQSRDKFVLEKLRSASQSLRTQEFQKAVENQELAEKELSALLKLLLSEDRSKRIRDEKERYTKLIKDLKRNLNNQRSARARNENGADLEDVQDEQKSVTRRSEQLKDRLAGENESENQSENKSSSADSEQQDGEQQDGDGQSKEQQGEKENGEKEQEGSAEKSDDKDKQDGNKDKQDGDKDKKENDGQQKGEPSKQDPSDQSKSGKGESPQQQKQSSQQQSGQPQDSQSPSKQNPSQQNQSQQGDSDSQNQQSPATPEEEVEQRLQQAIENMRRAEEELEKSKRDQATEKQRAAEENLRAAIDRLERILRQLREEEMQRELAKLESRLRKMAAMQTKVLDDTVALAATPVSQRNRQTDLKAGNLAFEEKKITLEADRAMLLLREEGSSVAFPEVVSQIRGDTTRVADLLGQTKIDAVTQGIQQDILAALEEMIGALQKAQRDLEKKRQQQQQPGKSRPSSQGEQPLVEALAELKLIRTVERRIKSTTDRYSGLLESGESSKDEMDPLIQDLSDRQNRLYQITRDLVLRRNK